MTDWQLVARISAGGFGSTLIVLAILCAVIWLIGFAIRKGASRGKDRV